MSAGDYGMGAYAMLNSLSPYGYGSPLNGFTAGSWHAVDPAQLQNQLGALSNYRQQSMLRRQYKLDAACRWFATKWRTRASEIGVQAAARLMRKQGVPCDVAVSILAMR